ncbi:MAG: glycerol-3-phosphate acyltransferase [Deltaproteobacteria bacterium]|nr:glycerol-3-phosphate acyltransferase [Deltaproteobacteria bacterium]
MTHNELVLYLACSFAIGSIPFGWIIAKLWGISDLRTVGSSNIGATNVVRTAGWLPGALTFGLDFAKGVVPIVYFPDNLIWYGLLAVLGHCFSPFLTFRGGTGVSTPLGAMVAFNPWLGGVSILVYAVTLGVLRVSALGSLFAMLAGLSGTMLYAHTDAAKIAVALMVLVVLARHRENWNKLLNSAVAVALLAGLLATAPPAAGAADPETDFRGKPIVSKTKPLRVAALIPSLAEMVVDLGAGARLVGVPLYARLPKDLEGHVAQLGAYNAISAEVVYSLHPDLVLASMDGNDATMVGQLEKLGLRVVTINTQSLADIVRSAQIVATALGDPRNAKVAALKRTMEKTPPSKSVKTKVFVQIGWEPLVTISHATYIDELVRLAGGANIFADTSVKYPRPNPEEIIARNPDVIVICRLTDTGDEVDRARAFWERFQKLNAIKNHRLYVMPVDWLTKPGFNLMDGVKELQRIL